MAVTDWQQVLSAGNGNELYPGAAEDEIAVAEAALEAVFPRELRGIYRASNGLLDRPGQWQVIWPLADVVGRNQEAWELEDSPFRRRLVGFGDDGTGVAFCVRRDGGDGVFAWSAFSGEATRLGRSVASFWSGWVAGTLPGY